MTEFRDNVDAARYEWDERGVVSFCDYRVGHDGVVALTHVETPAEARGQGAAARLMQAMVTHARSQTLKLRPVCSYAVAYFRRHADAGDVLG
jgi:uncharacterized protein